MSELVRAIASHDAGIIGYHLDAHGGTIPDGVNKILDAVDYYLLNRPGYKVTVTVEREDGLVKATAPGGRLSGYMEWGKGESSGVEVPGAGQ